MRIGDVVTALTMIIEEDSGKTFALEGELGRVLAVEDGCPTVAWPRGATLCDPSELAPLVSVRFPDRRSGKSGDAILP
jgi:hypothetical protein